MLQPRGALKVMKFDFYLFLDAEIHRRFPQVLCRKICTAKNNSGKNAPSRKFGSQNYRKNQILAKTIMRFLSVFSGPGASAKILPVFRGPVPLPNVCQSSGARCLIYVCHPCPSQDSRFPLVGPCMRAERQGKVLKPERSEAIKRRKSTERAQKEHRKSTERAQEQHSSRKPI